MKSALTSYFDSAKRSCTLCHTYRNLKPSTDQKELALASTKKAYDLLKVAFKELRNEDSDIQKIEKIKRAKTLCLDAIDACNNCNKQRPRMKEIFIDIK